MSQVFSWVEVSKSALKYNIKQIKKIIEPKTKLMTVVKSNAYGHGMVEIARLATQYGSDYLATANLAEAIELRHSKIKTPILVLSYYELNTKDIEFAIKSNISLVVYSEKQARFINSVAQSIKKIANIHIKVDTGTSRLGILVEEAFDFILKVKKLKNINIEGLFSHFAASEENQKFTKKQLDEFKSLIKKLELREIKTSIKHFACSAATMTQFDSHFNMIRLGVSAYGLWPSQQTKKMVQKNFGKKFRLKPVLSLYTKIVQIKEIQKGSYIGYGCTKRVNQKTKLAVLSIGYFEGFDRHLSNVGNVLIAGKSCPIMGRVCMNLIMVDISKIKNVKVGDRVTLIGRGGESIITVDDIALHVGTINYEVVTRINQQVKRIYVQ